MIDEEVPPHVRVLLDEIVQLEARLISLRRQTLIGMYVALAAPLIALVGFWIDSRAITWAVIFSFVFSQGLGYRARKRLRATIRRANAVCEQLITAVGRHRAGALFMTVVSPPPGAWYRWR